MDVHATIDGKPVRLTDWSCDAAVNWGYRTLTGKIPESVTWAEQEAPITLWLPDGTELWAGKLSLDPQTDRGKRALRAEGFASDLEAATTRMFYRIDSAERWSEQEEEPFVRVNNDKFGLTLRPGMLKWKMGTGGGAGADFVSGNQAGFIIWVEGGFITRVNFLETSGGTYSAFDLQGFRLTGPTGTPTSVGSFTPTSGATSRTFTISSPEDAFILQISANTGAVASTLRVTRVSALKVYGRTTDDNFSASEVVTDVGTTDGFDTSGVQSNTLAVLPVDWTEPHPDLLTYMAELTDWQWQALGDRLTFGPFETTWTAYQSHGVRTVWENQKRYNHVQVPFTYRSGAAGKADAYPETDPFPGADVVYTTEPLVHPQSDSTLAAAVAAGQAEYWASKRAAGRIELGQVTSSSGEPTDGSKVRPGHLLDVKERPDLGPQRVVAMNYRENGPPIAEVGRDFNPVRLLAEVQRERKKRRKR